MKCIKHKYQERYQRNIERLHYQEASDSASLNKMCKRKNRSFRKLLTSMNTRKQKKQSRKLTDFFLKAAATRPIPNSLILQMQLFHR